MDKKVEKDFEKTKEFLNDNNVLSSEDKMELEQAVDRIILEYAETLKLLAIE